MDDHALRELIRQVATGALSRRRFVEAMIGLGLTAPMAAQMLAIGGSAHAQPRTPAFTPTRRGGGGQLRKQAAAKAGIDLELKAVAASVYFSSDAANVDTFSHFYTDLQMYNTGPGGPDPQYYMEQFVSWQVASKENSNFWNLANWYRT